MNSENLKTNWGQFIPLVTVFFFWGFVDWKRKIKFQFGFLKYDSKGYLNVKQQLFEFLFSQLRLEKYMDFER